MIDARLPMAARRLGARLAPRRTAPKADLRIALIGNCQASAMACAMRLLRPDAEIVYLSTGTLGRRRRRAPEALAGDLAAFDHVFAQTISSGHVGPDHYDVLRDRHGGFGAVPSIVFAAFHPDLVYVGGPGTRQPDFVESPIGHYNSALALCAYLAGIPWEGALRLFDGEVMRHLGYLDLWSYASETLIGLGRDAGLDLTGGLARWARRGCFMHSVNHPRMIVAADIARLLLQRAGLAFTDFDLDGYLVDDLMLKGMWPVYEPVARHYGVPGSYVFQGRRPRRGAPGSAPLFSLAQYVAGSYARYAAVPRHQLVCDRVESWLASDDTTASFRHWAS